jgi:hypothetical protein
MPIAAAIIGDDFVGAVFAARDMPAEGRRATALDRRHYLQLAEAQVAGIGLAPCRSVVAEDIRDLQNRTHEGWGLCGRLVTSALQWGQAIQRAHDVPDGVGGDARVERGRIELRVPQKNLDHADIDVLLKQVLCKTVPQGMRGDALGDLGHLGRRVAGAIELTRRHRVDRVKPGKQPDLWPRDAPPVAQKVQ